MAIYRCTVKIFQRSKGRSAVAGSAYRSGMKLTNEWDGQTHDFTRKRGIVHTEIMLPPHAPLEFSDRSTLWNSVEQIEKAKDGPHTHIMLTIRPLKESGEWGAKCRKVYDLDERGQRIPDGKGGWKNHREDTIDWNDRGNVELWRKAWADYTNRALIAANQQELVDHRSYKRQGIDKIPTAHMGVAATQMEKRGVQTRKGDLNRQIAADNKLLKEIKARITQLYNWSKEEAAKPQGKDSIMNQLWQAQHEMNHSAACSNYDKAKALKQSAALFNFLHGNGITSMQQLHEKISAMNGTYYDLRGQIVSGERRLKVLDEHLKMWAQYEKHKGTRRPVSGKSESQRRANHAEEMAGRGRKADRTERFTVSADESHAGGNQGCGELTESG